MEHCKTVLGLKREEFHFLKEFKEGVHYIVRDKGVAKLVLLMAFIEVLMKEEGILASSIGVVIGTGEGSGIGLMLILSGLCMMVVAFVLGSAKSIRGMEVISNEYELNHAKE